MWGRVENVAGEQYFGSSLLLAETKLYTSTKILLFSPTCCYAHSHRLLTFEQRVQRLPLLYCPSDATRVQVSGTLVLKSFSSPSPLVSSHALCQQPPPSPKEKKKESNLCRAHIGLSCLAAGKMR